MRTIQNPEADLSWSGPVQSVFWATAAAFRISLQYSTLSPRRRHKNVLHYAACGIAAELCARLCHQTGGELDQIQFLLGHVSVQTTERYLGCK
jgi:hypothetical protein